MNGNLKARESALMRAIFNPGFAFDGVLGDDAPIADRMAMAAEMMNESTKHDGRSAGDASDAQEPAVERDGRSTRYVRIVKGSGPAYS